KMKRARMKPEAIMYKKKSLTIDKMLASKKKQYQEAVIAVIIIMIVPFILKKLTKLDGIEPTIKPYLS
ncbi:9772_t:CDS:1, partial [Acaulospora morrowiae]